MDLDIWVLPVSLSVLLKDTGEREKRENRLHSIWDPLSDSTDTTKCKDQRSPIAWCWTCGSDDNAQPYTDTLAPTSSWMSEQMAEVSDLCGSALKDIPESTVIRSNACLCKSSYQLIISTLWFCFWLLGKKKKTFNEDSDDNSAIYNLCKTFIN